MTGANKSRASESFEEKMESFVSMFGCSRSSSHLRDRRWDRNRSWSIEFNGLKDKFEFAESEGEKIDSSAVMRK